MKNMMNQFVKCSFFLAFSTLATMSLSSGCGRTTTLPPIGTSTPDSQNQNSGSENPSGASGPLDPSTFKRQPPSTDPTVKLIADYLAAKPIAVSKNGNYDVCFTNLSSPCSGTYRDENQKSQTLSATDACDVAIVDGKILLTLWDKNNKLLHWISVTAPASFIPPPSVIEDSSVKIILNQPCKL